MESANHVPHLALPVLLPNQLAQGVLQVYTYLELPVSQLVLLILISQEPSVLHVIANA